MAKMPAKPTFMPKKGTAPKPKSAPPKSSGKMMKQCKCGGHGG